jgi:hypothetical protein
VRRAINDPPSHLTRVRGDIPHDGVPVGAWIEGVTLIGTSRLEHGITDTRNALGPRPCGPLDRSMWRDARSRVGAIIESAEDRPQRLPPDIGIELDL